MTKEKTLDVRGLSCPVPLVKVQKALQEMNSQTITVLSDCATAKENISRFLEREGYAYKVAQAGEELHITIQKK